MQFIPYVLNATLITLYTSKKKREINRTVALCWTIWTFNIVNYISPLEYVVCIYMGYTFELVCYFCMRDDNLLLPSQCNILCMEVCSIFDFNLYSPKYLGADSGKSDRRIIIFKCQTCNRLLGNVHKWLPDKGCMDGTIQLLQDSFILLLNFVIPHENNPLFSYNRPICPSIQN